MPLSAPSKLASLNYQYPGGTLRPVQQRLQDRVSIMDFGVNGGGIVDTTAALSAAFNAAAAAGGPVRLWAPPGIYILSSIIVNIAGDLDFLGAGENCIFRGNTAGVTLFTFQFVAGFSTGGLRLRGCQFDANVGLANVTPFIVTT